MKKTVYWKPISQSPIGGEVHVDADLSLIAYVYHRLESPMLVQSLRTITFASGRSRHGKTHTRSGGGDNQGALSRYFGFAAPALLARL
jgi:hypothetical protein